MWPNYYNGYPQCCDLESAGGDTEALRPEEVVRWSSWPDLQQYWPDKTAQSGSSCAVCLMVRDLVRRGGGHNQARDSRVRMEEEGRNV